MADRCVLNFALCEGRVVSVDAVPLGADCNCVCPNPTCGERLIAKNRDFHGRKIRKHFAHQSKTNCPGARESALHLLAKQIIANGKRVAAPSVPLFDTGEKRWREFRPPHVLTFDRVDVEKSIAGFTPDLIGMDGEELTMVEIRVTHAVEEAKWRAAVRHGWTMLEIDVSHFLARDHSEQEVLTFLNESFDRRRWINHGAAAALRGRFYRAADFLQSGEACPAAIGKVPAVMFTADFSDFVWTLNGQTSPCERCEFRLETSPNALFCTGRTRVDSLLALERLESGATLPEPEWMVRFRQQQAIDAEFAALSAQRTTFYAAEARWNRAVADYFLVRRRTLQKALNRMTHAITTARKREQVARDEEWQIPIMEYSGNRDDGPRPCRFVDGRPQRLRPLQFKKRVLPALSGVMGVAAAATHGLYWDSAEGNWCFVSSGGVSEIKGRLVRDSVPEHIRSFLDSSSKWIPVFPEDRANLKGAQAGVAASPDSAMGVADAPDDSFAPDWVPATPQAKVDRAPNPDTIVAPQVGKCPVCGGEQNRIRFRDGPFEGREAVRCASNSRHPYRLCEPLGKVSSASDIAPGISSNL